MKKQFVKAVHEKDLEQLLNNLGLSEVMARGELKCSICGVIITLDNLLCVYPSGDEVKVCCNKRECYEKVFKRTYE